MNIPQYTVQLPDFHSARILVVGDVMLDRYWIGGCNRICPEAPVPVVHVAESKDAPGGAANVAMNIVTLGGSVMLAGVIGADEPGRVLTHLLAAANVSCRLIAAPGSSTITKIRVLSRNQQLIRLDFENTFDVSHSNNICGRIRDLVTEQDAIVFSDYAKGTLAAIPSMIDVAREARVPILVDPKGTEFGRYRGATILTPNLGEFEAVVGPVRGDKEMVRRGRVVITDLGLEYLLITQGENGMTLLGRDGIPLHIPAKARDVFDVTGAGDTVLSTLAAALACGTSIDQACQIANVAAGIAVTKLGAVAVTFAEIGTAMENDVSLYTADKKVCDPGGLASRQFLRYTGSDLGEQERQY